MSQLILIEKDELSSLIKEAVKDGYRMAKDSLERGGEYPPNMREQLASKYIGIAVGTIRNWRALGIGPKFTRHGRGISYAKADLDAYITKNKVVTHA